MRASEVQPGFKRIVTLKVDLIKFSQASVRDYFSCGRSLMQTVTDLIMNKIDPADIPFIRVVQWKGEYITLDNRRLQVFKTAQVAEIAVALFDLSHSVVYTEFIRKKTNRTSEGGSAALSSYSLGITSHFDGGIYKFTKIILNWSLEQIKLDAPLMDFPHEAVPISFANLETYYKCFSPLILEEARATFKAELELIDARRSIPLLAKVESFKRAKKNDNPSTLRLIRDLRSPLAIKSNDAVLLVSEDSSIEIVGLATEVKDPFAHLFSIKLVPSLIHYCSESLFDEGQKWKVYALGSVVTLLRMFDACSSPPSLSWQRQLIAPYRAEDSVSALLVDMFGVREGIGLLSKEETLLKDLNPSQQLAIRGFLKTEEGMSLIEGPPGTGKTTTIVSLLKILAERHEKTLVCAPSNKAVQILVERFVTENPGLPVAFAGVEDMLPETNSILRSVFIHTYGQDQIQKLQSLYEQVLELNHGTILKFIVNHKKKLEDIVAAVKLKIDQVKIFFIKWFNSISRYHFSFLADIREVLALFESEIGRVRAFAEYLIELELKAAKSEADKLELTKRNLKLAVAKILMLLMKVQMAVLEADELEEGGLEAEMLANSVMIFATLSVSGRKIFKGMRVHNLIVDEAGQAVEAETLIPFCMEPKRICLIGDIKQLPATVISEHAKARAFDRSLMERMIEGLARPTFLLDTQYRMDPEISQWPSARYYGGLLKNALSIYSRSALLTRVDSALGAYAFIDVPGSELSGGVASHSFMNEKEADWVVNLIHYLSRQSIDVNASVGVISFYAAQIELIKSRLSRGFRDVKVSTVDGFQGGENDIIIISFVRSNPRGMIGFVRDVRRLNVALTRARYQLIMLGNATALSAQKHDVAELIKNAYARKKFFAVESLKPVITPSIGGKSTVFAAAAGEASAGVARVDATKARFTADFRSLVESLATAGTAGAAGAAATEVRSVARPSSEVDRRGVPLHKEAELRGIAATRSSGSAITTAPLTARGIFPVSAGAGADSSSLGVQTDEYGRAYREELVAATGIRRVYL